MAAKNDITGDSIKSKTSTKAYADGWEKIFGKKKKTKKNIGGSSNGRTADFDSVNRGSNP